MIELRGVEHTYRRAGGAPFTALSDLDLTIQRGTWVAVVGRSGSGKSTLLNLIAGLDRPARGTHSMNGARIDTLGESALARWRGRSVGVVFQFFQLMPLLTIRENMLLAMELVGRVPRSARDAKAVELLEWVGISEQLDKLPGALSGGQQQRAAIARALVNDPPLLVADEPTGNLDSSSAEAVLGVFERLRQRGTTLVVVTHDPEIARRADRSIRLVDGRLAAPDGGPS